MTFELRDIVPWGRSFDEYVALFSLTGKDVSRRILGCADGPASFNAVLSRREGNIVSCDPMYRFSQQEIRSRIDETASTIAAELSRNSDEFVWDRFGSVEDLIETRMRAMDEFLRDYPSGKQADRYLDASLPNLPFPADRFDLALCAHFLFLYSEQHDAQFHIHSILELSRVAAEVRIFPLVELGSVPSRHLHTVIDSLGAFNVSADVVRVPYEFQKGGNEMLRVRRIEAAQDS